MRHALLVLLSLAIALGLGGWSANWALEQSSEIGTVTFGPWQANPFAGAPDADPYSKARLARIGNLTLGIGEGILFTADRDASDARSRATASTASPARRRRRGSGPWRPTPRTGG